MRLEKGQIIWVTIISSPIHGTQLNKRKKFTVTYSSDYGFNIKRPGVSTLTNLYSWHKGNGIFDLENGMVYHVKLIKPFTIKLHIKVIIFHLATFYKEAAKLWWWFASWGIGYMLIHLLLLQ